MYLLFSLITLFNYFSTVAYLCSSYIFPVYVFIFYWIIFDFQIIPLYSPFLSFPWNKFLIVNDISLSLVVEATLPSQNNAAGFIFFPPISLIISCSVQFSSVAQLCLTLCNPMNRSTPGLPVHHQLPEFTQTQVHQVSDAIQPSHPLSSPSPPAPNPSQHQSLFQWVNSSHEVAKVLEFQL